MKSQAWGSLISIQWLDLILSGTADGQPLQHSHDQSIIKTYDIVDDVMVALAKLKQDPPPNTTEHMLNPFHST